MAEAAAAAAAATDPLPPSPSSNTKTNTNTKSLSNSTSPVPSVTGMFVNLVSIFLDKSLLLTMPEIGHLAPIILTAGSLFFAAVSLNYPLAMIGLSAIEAGGIYKLVNVVSAYAGTPLTAESKENAPNCSSYFQTLSSSRFRFLVGEGLKGSFPNYALYFITFISAYCIESMSYFKDECSALGSQYSNRPYLAYMSAAMLIILYSLYLLVYGCDSLINLFCSAVLGLLIGYLLCYQNASMLGKDSVNILFIPTIVKRSGMDYICVSSAS